MFNLPVPNNKRDLENIWMRKNKFFQRKLLRKARTSTGSIKMFYKENDKNTSKMNYLTNKNYQKNCCIVLCVYVITDTKFNIYVMNTL